MSFQFIYPKNTFLFAPVSVSFNTSILYVGCIFDDHDEFGPERMNLDPGGKIVYDRWVCLEMKRLGIGNLVWFENDARNHQALEQLGGSQEAGEPGCWQDDE